LLPHSPSSAGIGFGVPIGRRSQRGGDLGGCPRPLPELVHDVIDGGAERITASDVHATRCGAVEHQPGHMRPHGALDDVGGRLVLARDGVQRRHIDPGDIRLSHTRFDAGEPRPVPTNLGGSAAVNFSAGC
jgi:hypothetical protein